MKKKIIWLIVLSAIAGIILGAEWLAFKLAQVITEAIWNKPLALTYWQFAGIFTVALIGIIILRKVLKRYLLKK